jgi:7-cyano-7-deazaguanine synthase in queuosine biosynthesis
MNKIKRFVCCCFTCVEVSEQVVPQNNITNNELDTPLLNTDTTQNYINDKQLQYKKWFTYTNKYYNPKKSLKCQNIEKKRNQYFFYKSNKVFKKGHI